MSRSGPGPMSLATGPGPMGQAVDPGRVIGLGSVWARDQWPKPMTLFLLVELAYSDGVTMLLKKFSNSPSKISQRV